MSPTTYLDAILALTSPPSNQTSRIAQRVGYDDSRIIELLTQWATERLRQLAVDHFGSMFVTFPPREVDDLAAGLASEFQPVFAAHGWAKSETLINCLLDVADSVRRHLLKISDNLKTGNAERVGHSGHSTKSGAKSSKKTTSPVSTIATDPVRFPINWDMFHQSVGELPEPHHTTWLLAHYLGLSRLDYRRLVNDLTPFDQSNREARVMIQETLDSHNRSRVP